MFSLRGFIIGFISFYLLGLVPEANAANCAKNPIFCHIKRLKPNIRHEKAIRLSNIFHKSARKYKVNNPIRSVAIAMQETSLNLKLSRKQNVIVFNDDMTAWEVIKGYSDICMFQFHVNTIVNEKLDPIRLKTDINYCTDQHFKLMKKKIKACKHLGDEAWTCYHSRTSRLRKRYKEDVERYY